MANDYCKKYNKRLKCVRKHNKCIISCFRNGEYCEYFDDHIPVLILSGGEYKNE